jgi:glycosidase
MLAVMTLPGAPCIYYGDEVGMVGRHDPDSRRGFPWDESKWNKGLHDFVRGLTALRTREPLLRRGAFRSLAAAGDAVAYGRFPADGAAADGMAGMIVAINAGETPARVSFSAGELAGTHLEPVDLPGMAAPAIGQPPADGSAWIDVPRRSGTVVLARRGSA